MLNKLIPEVGVIGLIIIFLCAIIFILIILRTILSIFKIKRNFNIGNGQTIGKKDRQNDYFSTSISQNGIFAVVADGIKDTNIGSIASISAVNIFIREFNKIDVIDDYKAFFAKVIRKCNNELIVKLKGAKGGASIAAILLHEGKMYWASVGNVKIMISKDDEIVNVNKKHIYKHMLEEGVLKGYLKERNLEKYKQYNEYLINFVGYEEFKNAEIYERPIEIDPTDKIIVCTDGIFKALTEIELINILKKNNSPYKASQKIIEEVNSKKLKDQDNGTIVIVG